MRFQNRLKPKLKSNLALDSQLAKHMNTLSQHKKIKINDYDSVKNWTYKLAQKWVQTHVVPLGISSSRKFYDSKQVKEILPKNFPRYPRDFFEKRGTWVSWEDFFGVETTRPKSKFLLYHDAKKTMKRYPNIVSSADYYGWTNRPQSLPARPNLTYKENWEGWNMFLNSQPEPKFKNAKITENIARVIKHQLQLGVPGAALARQFAISEMQVTRIKRGENWSHITM